MRGPIEARRVRLSMLMPPALSRKYTFKDGRVFEGQYQNDKGHGKGCVSLTAVSPLH